MQQVKMFFFVRVCCVKGPNCRCANGCFSSVTFIFKIITFFKCKINNIGQTFERLVTVLLNGIKLKHF